MFGMIFTAINAFVPGLGELFTSWVRKKLTNEQLEKMIKGLIVVTQERNMKPTFLSDDLLSQYEQAKKQ